MRGDMLRKRLVSYIAYRFKETLYVMCFVASSNGPSCEQRITVEENKLKREQRTIKSLQITVCKDHFIHLIFTTRILLFWCKVQMGIAYSVLLVASV